MVIIIFFFLVTRAIILVIHAVIGRSALRALSASSGALIAIWRFATAWVFARVAKMKIAAAGIHKPIAMNMIITNTRWTMQQRHTRS